MTDETITQTGIEVGLLWECEGGASVSDLVRLLAAPYGQIGTQSKSSDDVNALVALASRAHHIAGPFEDWEGAALQAGWTMIDEDKFELQPDDEDEPVTASSWETACYISDVEPLETAVVEHLVVSDWLARELASAGERVEQNFAGMAIWARVSDGPIGQDPALMIIAGAVDPLAMLHRINDAKRTGGIGSHAPEIQPYFLNDQDHATIMAALRFYQEAGMGEPCNRSDAIHDIATAGDLVTSMDADGIDELCMRLNVNHPEFEIMAPGFNEDSGSPSI